MKNRIYIDTFSSTDHLRGKARTYEALKEATLAAGRFSCFEASDGEKNQGWFTQLMRDPEIEKVEMAYPWVGVRRKQPLAASDAEPE